jgi:hypothetical protein
MSILRGACMAVSYATDIRPLFRPIDISRMAFFCDLASYDDVKTNAPHLLGRLKGEAGPVMPPVSTGGPWSADNIALFEKWIDEGCQP